MVSLYLNPDGWLMINQWGDDADKPLDAALVRGLFHRHYWEIPVKEGSVVLLVPASLEQTLPFAVCRLPNRGSGLIDWHRG